MINHKLKSTPDISPFWYVTQRAVRAIALIALGFIVLVPLTTLLGAVQIWRTVPEAASYLEALQVAIGNMAKNPHFLLWLYLGISGFAVPFISIFELRRAMNEIYFTDLSIECKRNWKFIFTPYHLKLTYSQIKKIVLAQNGTIRLIYDPFTGGRFRDLHIFSKNEPFEVINFILMQGYDVSLHKMGELQKWEMSRDDLEKWYMANRT